MSPITHFLVGWTLLEQPQADDRDRALVVLAGIAPDLDGVGIVVDFATRLLGLPETDYYQATHRVYGHGLPAAFAIAIVVALLATRRPRAALYAFIAVHLHFLCDLLGSRGTSPEDLWGIAYLTPLSQALSFEWTGQWPLVGWQNMLITAVLLGWTLRRALASGYTPLRLLSPRADGVLVATLRNRFRRQG